MALWSGNWVIGRAFRADIPPITLAFLRWGSAFLFLLPFAWRGARRDWPIVRKHIWRILGMGASGAAIFHSFVYTGLHSTEAINGTLLNSMGPIIIVLIAWIVFGDTINRRQAIGIGVSFIGTIFLVSRGNLENILSLKINSGDIWILSAMFFWGIYSVLLRNIPKNISGITLLIFTAASAIMFLAPGVVFEYMLGYRVTFGLPVFAAISYIGIFATIIAYYCYNSAVARIGPNQTGIILYLLPVFGAVAAIVFLDETLKSYHLIGFAIILLGIFLATWRARK
ncbi:MAG: DMT family transporter [Rhizobiales bacterium]|nr:DMT family transporter [Hyphomicrobiales bacterium]